MIVRVQKEKRLRFTIISNMPIEDGRLSSAKNEPALIRSARCSESWPTRAIVSASWFMEGLANSPGRARVDKLVTDLLAVLDSKTRT
jgi:hypothetical protein